VIRPYLGILNTANKISSKIRETEETCEEESES
jgi:hypothetical protein